MPSLTGSYHALQIFAAGSLRGPLADISEIFSQAHGINLQVDLGPSGVLRQRIEAGPRPDLFLSADRSHPQILVDLGIAANAVPFARNSLCLFGPEPPALEIEVVIDRMLDAACRLGTSTPIDDPGGDYAFRVFEKIDQIRPGSYARLAAKAHQLVGGRDSRAVPQGTHPVADLFERKAVDLFLGYYTSAIAVQKKIDGIGIQTLPEPIAVTAEYVLSKLKTAQPAGDRFIEFLFSETGGRILSAHGFLPNRQPR
jgi:molybdate transport system substrate-binding protein